MTNEPKAMKEIHDIRLQIYEETKGLTEAQCIERTNNAVCEMEKKYGIIFRRPGDNPARKVM